MWLIYYLNEKMYINLFRVSHNCSYDLVETLYFNNVCFLRLPTDEFIVK